MAISPGRRVACGLAARAIDVVLQGTVDVATGRFGGAFGTALCVAVKPCRGCAQIVTVAEARPCVGHRAEAVRAHRSRADACARALETAHFRIVITSVGAEYETLTVPVVTKITTLWCYRPSMIEFFSGEWPTQSNPGRPALAGILGF